VAKVDLASDGQTLFRAMEIILHHGTWAPYWVALRLSGASLTTCLLRHPMIALQKLRNFMAGFTLDGGKSTGGAASDVVSYKLTFYVLSPSDGGFPSC